MRSARGPGFSREKPVSESVQVKKPSWRKMTRRRLIATLAIVLGGGLVWLLGFPLVEKWCLRERLSLRSLKRWSINKDLRRPESSSVTIAAERGFFLFLCHDDLVTLGWSPGYSASRPRNREHKRCAAGVSPRLGDCRTKLSDWYWSLQCGRWTGH